MNPAIKVTVLFLIFLSLMGESHASPRAADELFRESYAYEENGDIPSALRVSRELVEIEDSYDAWLRLAWLENLSRNWDQALAAYERALVHAPGSRDALLGKLSVLDARGLWKESLELSRDLLGSDRENAMARRFLAHSLFRTRRYSSALPHYRTLAALAPEDGEICLGLGLTLVRLGHRDAARPWIERAEAALPRGDPRIASALGEASNDWKVKAGVHGFVGQYSGSNRYTSFSGVQVTGSAKDPDGGEILVDYSRSGVTGVVQSSLTRERFGLGFTRETGDSRWLLHWTQLDGAEAYLGNGSVISSRWDRGSKGVSLDFGSYDYFQTLELSPRFTHALGKGTLTWSPRVLKRWGTLLQARQEEDLLPSLGLEYFRSSLRRLFWAKAYVGSRWFSSENSGRVIWNSDEELDGGLEVGLQILRDRTFSPSLSLRMDHIRELAGVANDATVLTVSLGATLSF